CVLALEVVSTNAVDGWVLAERWDGEQWSIQSTASPTWPLSNANGVSCAHGGGCTLVGTKHSVQRLRFSRVASTEPATVVRSKGATLNARVNPEGFETTYQFEYTGQADFEKNGYKNAVAVPTSPKGVGSGTSSIAVSRTVSGLKPSSKYHFRVKATNSAGTTYGEDETLTTAEPGRRP